MKKQRSEAEITHSKARFNLAKLLPRSSSSLLSPLNRKNQKQRQRIQAGFAAMRTVKGGVA
jgi:hypothetical protein